MESSHTKIIARAPRRSGRKKKRLNWSYALLSIVIGALLWFGIDLKRMEDLSLDVEIRYQRHLPQDWKFVEPPPKTAKIVIRSTRQDLSNIRIEEVFLEPDMPAGALDGDTYNGGLSLSPQQVRGLPAGVEVQSVTPAVAQVRLAKILSKYLTVEPGSIVGTPQDGYSVGKVHQIDPPAMPVSGSQAFLAKLGANDVLRTRDFSVEGGRGLVGGMVGLQPLEKDGETIQVPGMVYMTVELEEVPSQREFEQPFEVRALIDSPFDRYTNLNITPPSVRVTVAGPKNVVDNMNPSEITIYADFKERIPAAPGEYNLKCRAVTPARVRVVKIEPDTVKWLTRE